VEGPSSFVAALVPARGRDDPDGGAEGDASSIGVVGQDSPDGSECGGPVGVRNSFEDGGTGIGLDESDQLSQAEAAAFLRVSRMQVNRWVRAGKLQEKKTLGTSRITVRELLRFAKATGRELGPKGLLIIG
jgi:hypothetical protein